MRRASNLFTALDETVLNQFGHQHIENIDWKLMRFFESRPQVGQQNSWRVGSSLVGAIDDCSSVSAQFAPVGQIDKALPCPMQFLFRNQLVDGARDLFGRKI